MFSKINRIFTLNEHEYCYNLEKTGTVSPGQTMKMYVPKLMASIGLSSKGKVTPVMFPGHNSVFINDPPCRPSCGKTISSANYINIPLINNNNASGSFTNAHGQVVKISVNNWDTIAPKGIVPSGTKFLCQFINGEITRGYFNTNL